MEEKGTAALRRHWQGEKEAGKVEADSLSLASPSPLDYPLSLYKHAPLQTCLPLYLPLEDMRRKPHHLFQEERTFNIERGNKIFHFWKAAWGNGRKNFSALVAF